MAHLSMAPLGWRRASFNQGSAMEEPVGGAAAQAIELFLDGRQEVLQKRFHFLIRSVRKLRRQMPDSVVESARGHAAKWGVKAGLARTIMPESSERCDTVHTVGFFVLVRKTKLSSVRPCVSAPLRSFW
jgi:hypothetical protein